MHHPASTESARTICEKGMEERLHGGDVRGERRRVQIATFHHCGRPQCHNCFTMPRDTVSDTRGDNFKAAMIHQPIERVYTTGKVVVRRSEGPPTIKSGIVNTTSVLRGERSEPSATG